MLTPKNNCVLNQQMVAGVWTTFASIFLPVPSNELLNDLHFQKCKILHSSGQSERAIESCEAARDHEQANSLLSQIYEESGDVESAINTLKSMIDLGFDTQDIHERIHFLQKRANQPRDYYKILDLPRNADEK